MSNTKNGKAVPLNPHRRFGRGKLAFHGVRVLKLRDSGYSYAGTSKVLRTEDNIQVDPANVMRFLKRYERRIREAAGGYPAPSPAQRNTPVEDLPSNSENLLQGANQEQGPVETRLTMLTDEEAAALRQSVSTKRKSYEQSQYNNP